jgi:hypothetical protein
MKNKKPLLLFAPSLILVTLSGACSTTTVDQVPITFGQLYDSSLLSSNEAFVSLTHAELTSLASNGYNFVLLVYNANSTCTCWHLFRETIGTYMAATNLRIYLIDYQQFTDEESFGLTVSSTEETIAIFEDGAPRYQRTRDGTEDSFANTYSVFKEWMDARVHASDMIYVTEDQLDELYEGDEAFTVGFLRSTCGDCAYVDNYFLKEFNASDNNVSYVIECDVEGIRYYNGIAPGNTTDPTDAALALAQWQSFKDEYGLSTTYDVTFGFDTGYVPTWYHINPAGFDAANDHKAEAIDDGDVWVNDSLTAASDGTYTVTNTYFTEERLTSLEAVRTSEVTTKVLFGLSVPSTDVDSYGGWTHAAAAVYHDPLLNAFLTSYVAK